jgi:AcrR family transcriptional regulator
MQQKDLRQLKTQAKLHKAYISLQKQGYEKLTIQQLCKEASITRATFYNQFQDVYELRLDLHDSLILELKKALTIINPKPLRELKKDELDDQVVNLFHHIEQNRHAYELLLVLKPDALFMNQVKEIVKQFIIEGTNYSEAQEQLIEGNFDFIVSFYTGAYFESILWWIGNNYEPNAKEMSHTLIQTGLNGSIRKPIQMRE